MKLKVHDVSNESERYYGIVLVSNKRSSLVELEECSKSVAGSLPKDVALPYLSYDQPGVLTLKLPERVGPTRVMTVENTHGERSWH